MITINSFSFGPEPPVFHESVLLCMSTLLRSDLLLLFSSPTRKERLACSLTSPFLCCRHDDVNGSSHAHSSHRSPPLHRPSLPSLLFSHPYPNYHFHHQHRACSRTRSHFCTTKLVLTVLCSLRNYLFQKRRKLC